MSLSNVGKTLFWILSWVDFTGNCSDFSIVFVDGFVDVDFSFSSDFGT